VGPETPVARSSAPGRLLTVDLLRRLGVGAARVERYLMVAPGQQVEAGQLLARREGFFRNAEVRAPASGAVMAIEDGRLFMRETGRGVVLRAMLPGRVVRVIEGQGAEICCTGVRVSGLWGAGGEASGPLAVRAEQPDALLSRDRLGPEDVGLIVAGGAVADEGVLHQAREFGVAGLLVASLHPDLEPLAATLGLAMVSVAGLGRFSLSEPVHEALGSCSGATAVLWGTNVDKRYGPELIVPSTEAGSDVAPPAQTDAARISVGVLVRVTRPPHAGALGRVIDLEPVEPTADAYDPDLVEIRLADGQRVVLPQRNVEIMG